MKREKWIVKLGYGLIVVSLISQTFVYGIDEQKKEAESGSFASMLSSVTHVPQHWIESASDLAGKVFKKPVEGGRPEATEERYKKFAGLLKQDQIEHKFFDNSDSQVKDVKTEITPEVREAFKVIREYREAISKCAAGQSIATLSDDLINYLQNAPKDGVDERVVSGLLIFAKDLVEVKKAADDKNGSEEAKKAHEIDDKALAALTTLGLKFIKSENLTNTIKNQDKKGLGLLSAFAIKAMESKEDGFGFMHADLLKHYKDARKQIEEGKEVCLAVLPKAEPLAKTDDKKPEPKKELAKEEAKADEKSKTSVSTVFKPTPAPEASSIPAPIAPPAAKPVPVPEPKPEATDKPEFDLDAIIARIRGQNRQEIETLKADLEKQNEAIARAAKEREEKAKKLAEEAAKKDEEKMKAFENLLTTNFLGPQAQKTPVPQPQTSPATSGSPTPAIAANPSSDNSRDRRREQELEDQLNEARDAQAANSGMPVPVIQGANLTPPPAPAPQVVLAPAPKQVEAAPSFQALYNANLQAQNQSNGIFSNPALLQLLVQALQGQGQPQAQVQTGFRTVRGGQTVAGQGQYAQFAGTPTLAPRPNTVAPNQFSSALSGMNGPTLGGRSTPVF